MLKNQLIDSLNQFVSDIGGKQKAIINERDKYKKLVIKKDNLIIKLINEIQDAIDSGEIPSIEFLSNINKKLDELIMMNDKFK